VGLPTLGGLYDERGRLDWRAAVRTVEEGWQQGDALYVHAHDHCVLGYYLERSALADAVPIVTYGNPDTRPVYVARSLDVIDFHDVTREPVTEQRLWHVNRVLHADFTPYDGDERLVSVASVDGAWIRHFTTEYPHAPHRTSSFAGLEVSLLERAEGRPAESRMGGHEHAAVTERVVR
jgi:hypothetical protein